MTRPMKALLMSIGILLLAMGMMKMAAAHDETSLDAELAALKETVAKMERRVERLRDVEEIENLISAYGYYLDKALWDHVADLFAENGEIEISMRGVYVGKASIRRSLELYGPHGLEHGHLHNHIQLQPVIHVAPDGKTAWSRHRALSQLGTYGQMGVWGGGVYENVYVKEDGVWKFQRDQIFTTFFAPYDKGWVAGARPTPKASDKIPPDGPPTVVYEALPDVYLPPFHYKNPVTGKDIEWPRDGAAGEAQ